MNIAQVRRWMQDKGVRCAYFTCRDPHQSESGAERWKTVQALTGFTGSAGAALVTGTEAAFWTDGRYAEQAARELAPEFRLFCTANPGDPSLSEWLLGHLPEGGALALDGSVISVADLRKFRSLLEGRGTLCTDTDSLLELWTDRPGIPGGPLWELEPRFACRSREEKLELVRSKLAAGETLLVSGLDEIAWLTNLRGSEHPLYPFFHAWALVSKEHAVLCTDIGRIPAEIRAELFRSGFSVLPYGQIREAAAGLRPGETLVLDPFKTPAALAAAVPPGARIRECPALVTEIKARKTAAERANVREANLRECAAVVRLMRWIEAELAAGSPLDEYAIGQKLEEFRRRDPLYLQPGNVPIVGCGPNAALPHYRPGPGKSACVKREGFLLFDVCAQYLCGTTDLTRTVAAGPLTEEMRTDYTRVLKAHVRLASQKFPEGTTGDLLDAAVKAPLWNEGIVYGHGTGHGIGYVSIVHEGPAKIEAAYAPAFPRAKSTPLAPGMLFSDEPGIYRPGRHGIRIENSVFVEEAFSTEFGRFLGFETVTFLPFENRAIRREMLSEAEAAWIRNYCRETREKLAPFLDGEERSWLAEKTDFA